MVWSLETDDFLGKCGGDKFNLIKTYYKALNGDYPPPPSTTTPDPTASVSQQTSAMKINLPNLIMRAFASWVNQKDNYGSGLPWTLRGKRYVAWNHIYGFLLQTTTSTTTAPTPPPSDVCKKPGLNPDPENDCSPVFYNCVQDGNSWIAHPGRCQDGTVFNPENLVCDFPSNVPGCSK